MDSSTNFVATHFTSLAKLSKDKKAPVLNGEFLSHWKRENCVIMQRNCTKKLHLC